MAERRPRGTQAEETVVVEKEKKDFDPRTLGVFVSLYIGGGLPPQIEVMGEQYLANYKIADGPFSDKEIREKYGFRNDSSANPLHSPYIEGPKTALQRAALELGRQASWSTHRTGTMWNPGKAK